MVIVREAPRRELERYIIMFETLEGEIIALKDLVEEYKEKINWIYFENENIFEKTLGISTFPYLDPNDIPPNIKISMLELDLRKIKLIETLEYLLRDLEIMVKGIKRTLKNWKKQLRISGDPINDYQYTRRELYLLVNKLKHIEEKIEEIA